jgi:hypothetical protein
MMGITDAMQQYERASEEILKKRPKHLKPYGIKRPETRNIISALAGLFFVLVVVRS